MPDDELTPTHGHDLAKMRRLAGIGQVELAKRLGIHRVTLGGIERDPAVTVIQAARYRRAVREIVAEETQVSA